MKTMRLLSSISVFLLAAFTLYGQVNFAISHSGQSAGLPLGSGSKPGQAGPIGEARIAMANVPLFFETNQGQTDPRVRFFSRGSGYTLFLTPEETVFVEGARRADLGRKSANLRDKAASPRSVLRMKLLGTRSAQRFAGAGELPGKVNYLIGNQSSGWHTGVPLYSQVRAQQVYPGVDLLFHGDAQQLEYDFVVAPEADPNQVAFRIEGAERIELDAQGNLDLHTAANEVTFHKPLVYQFVGAERRAVDGHFVLRGAREIGFAVGAYDRGQPLVIDPTITYSTFLGGAGQEDGDGVGLDTSTPGLPKMYIGGTTSDDTSFPETGSNVYFLGPSKNGSASEYIFVAEIDPTQTGAASLVYLTFIGGSAVPFAGTESPCDNHHGSLALETVNSTVEPVFGGITTCQDYPVTGGSKPTSGTNDIVLTRLEPGGAALDMSEFFGGNAEETDVTVFVDSSNNIVLASGTTSTNLPVTSGAYATKLDNGQTGDTFDCFAAKLNSSFVVQYLSYLNVGHGETLGSTPGGNLCGAVEDSSGNIVASGMTASSTDFSGVAGQPNGFQTTFEGSFDTFIMKLNPTLSGTSQLVYSTYLGGGGNTVPNAYVFVSGGMLAVGGNTTSGESGTLPNIPLANAYQNFNNADPSSTKGTGYAALVDTTQTGSSSLPCSTYLGGTGSGDGEDKVEGITYDPQNGDFSTLRLILSGQTTSPTFPTTSNALQSLEGSQDAFVVAMNVPVNASAGPAATLSFSTYLGGGFNLPDYDDKRETVRGVAVDANHNIYARGRSPSPTPYFFGYTNPATTVNGFQTTCDPAACNGDSKTANDNAVAFQLEGWEPELTISPTSLTFAGQVVGTSSASKSVSVTNTGVAPVSLLPITASGDFAVSNDTCPADPSTLAPTDSCSFSVSFTPTVPGSVPGEITITDTAAASPQLVSLTKGSGVKPISLSPTSYKFGTIAVGSTSSAETVTITNNLSTTLTVDSIAASGDYAVAPGAKSPCSTTETTTIASKKYCTVSVTFAPKQVESTINGAVTVTYDAAFSPEEVTLTGGGSGSATSPLTFSPTSGSFKDVPIGGSANQAVTATNSSASELSITGLTASGNYAATGCIESLAPNATCTMTVTFSPSVNGTISGSVAIANSTGVTPQIYNVSGSAVLPLIFTPTSLTFSAQPTGSTSAAKTVTLTNYGGTAMTISSIVASGDYAWVGSGKTPCGNGASLKTKGTCTIGVSFTPSTTGTIPGAITVTYSGVSPGFSPQEISLSGTGQ